MMINMEEIVSLCKRRGFIYPGSDVYGGLAGTWDYGPLGVALKRNIVNFWWQFFVENREDIYGVDAAIIMNPKTWVASGHVATFADPLVEDLVTKKRYRADHLLKDAGEKVDGLNSAELNELIKNKGILSPDGNVLGEVRAFNMMFQTNIGPVVDDNSTAYLRPETAQGIFTNYKNVVDSFYPDLPFGVAQVGKAFRNEISPRDFIFRTREFEQMEIEYFVKPEDWSENFEKILCDIFKFLELLKLPKAKIHQLEVPESDRAHYSQRTVDIEFDFPIGREELLGLAYRADYDLKNIQKHSGKSMEYIEKSGGGRLVPHVIEPSFGVERLVMAVLTSSYVKDGERVYLDFPASIAPVKVLVSPLLKNKPELVKKARVVYEDLKRELGAGAVMWDDSGNIGKRYAKADEIGVPCSVVVDFDSLTGEDVTVRDRNTTKQKRVKISDLSEYVKK
jgi:glycyl-tRNA synthetase